MKTILWIVLGAVIMFVLLKVLSKRDTSDSKVSSNFKKLADTQQVRNLVRTNEFRELVKTKEFKDLLFSLADDQLTTISKAMV